MTKDSKKQKDPIAETDFIEFIPASSSPSSTEFIEPEIEESLMIDVLAPSTKLEDMPPIFRELALPKLPELAKENRARLQMQSPNRLFFYWSVQSNPFQRLNSVLGTQTASYTLVLKLIDLKSDVEKIYPAEPEGSWWFDVEADGQYRAEIGFYATNRPYVRVLFSNDVETPRKSPSPRVDTEADWSISSDRFARVLEVAGFTQDAFDIALAGDDHEASEVATHAALSTFIGEPVADASGISADEIRSALLSLAAGASLESLRWNISPALFAILQRYADSLSAEKALTALTEQFDIVADEITEEEFGPAVFGASAINFPKRLKTRRTLPGLRPVSSYAGSASYIRVDEG